MFVNIIEIALTEFIQEEDHHTKLFVHFIFIQIILCSD